MIQKTTRGGLKCFRSLEKVASRDKPVHVSKMIAVTFERGLRSPILVARVVQRAISHDKMCEKQVCEILQPTLNRSVRLDANQICERFDPIPVDVHVFQSHVVAERLGSAGVVDLKNGPLAPQPALKAAIFVVVTVAIKPFETFAGQFQRAGFARREMNLHAGLQGVRRAVRVFASILQHDAIASDHPIPAAVLMIPHHIAQIPKAMNRRISPLRFIWERKRQQGGDVGLPRLKFQHALLRSARFPCTVEVAEEATGLTINAAREPDVNDMSAEKFEHLRSDVFTFCGG